MTHPSLSDINSRFSYEPSTGQLTYRSYKGPAAQLRRLAGTVAGYIAKDGYRKIVIGGRQYPAHRLIWFVHNQSWPTGLIDHINGQKDDNRIDNLRIATRTQNNGNQRKRLGTSSRFKGVTRHPSGWQAQIRCGSDAKYLGLFQSEDEAAASYNEAALRFFGPFAHLNEITPGAPS